MTITKKELETALDSRFEAQTEKLVEFLEDQFEEVNKRFDGVDERLGGVEDRLGVVEANLNRALYIEAVHTEARLRRLEKHAGLKSLAPPVKIPPLRK